MKALVTGGSGFLASHLVQRLVLEGHRVRTFDLPGRNEDELAKTEAEVSCGDLRDRAFIEQACAGMETVFHVAALASPWGPRELFWSINVTGTDNVIEACKKAGVKRLVQVSSPSAVFDGRDHFMADESLPYPSRFLSYYCETKAASEQRALAANGPDLEVTVIRPHVIWGPGDRHLLPRLIARSKQGRLLQIGDGQNRVSTLYVENGVDALLLAAESDTAPGNIYFITDEEPVALWEFIRRILKEFGLPQPRGKLPFKAAFALAAVYEAVWAGFKLKGEPLITKYTVSELAKNHTYSINKARKQLGYAPRFSLEEALQKVLAWVEEKGLPEPPR